MSPSALPRVLLVSVFTLSALAASEPPSPRKAERPAAERTDRFGDSLPPFALARLGTTRYHSVPQVLSAVLSPDGKTIAISTEANVTLVNAETGKESRRLPSDPWYFIRSRSSDSDEEPRRLRSRNRNGLFSPGFSADGRLLAAPSALPGSILVWNVALGKTVSDLTDAKLKRVQSLFKRLDRELRSGNGELAALLGCEQTVVFSGDGKLAAALVAGCLAAAVIDRGSSESWITTFDVESGKALKNPEIEPKLEVNGLAVSPDRKTLAWWGNLTDGDGMVELWDLQKHKKIEPLHKSRDFDIVTATFSPVGRTLATVTREGTVRIFDLASGDAVGKLEAARMTAAELRALRRDAQLLFSADGRQLILGTSDGTVRTWDIANGKQLPQRRCPFAGVQSWTPVDGHVAACSFLGNRVQVWDEKSSKSFGADSGHAARVAALAFSPDGKRLHSAAETGDFIDWDISSATGSRAVMLLPDKQLSRREPESSSGDHRLALSPTGKYAAVVSPDEMRVWDIEQKRVVQAFPAVTGWNPIAAFLGDGRLLAATENRVNIYGVPNGARQVSFPGSKGGLCSAAVSLDGKLAAGVAAPSRISVWRTDDGQEVADLWVPEAFPAGPNASQGLALSADGKRVAVVITGDRVRVLDTRTGRRLARPAGDRGKIGPICFSPDGRLLAVGCASRDRKQDDSKITGGTVQLWEIATDSVRTEFRGHDGGVTALAFSPDGRHLASGSSDSTILIWDVSGDGIVPRRDTRLTGTEKETLWQRLASPDAGAGYEAILRLCAASGDGVELLRSHLKPVPLVPDERELSRLMKLLDSRQAAERVLAEDRVMQVGPAIVPALRNAINASSSPELRGRAEALLMKILFSETPSETPEDSIRLTRALEVLERIATPQARDLVRSLALGRVDDPLTLEAKSALARMQQQR